MRKLLSLTLLVLLNVGFANAANTCQVVSAADTRDSFGIDTIPSGSKITLNANMYFLAGQDYHALEGTECGLKTSLSFKDRELIAPKNYTLSSFGGNSYSNNFKLSSSDMQLSCRKDMTIEQLKISLASHGITLELAPPEKY